MESAITQFLITYHLPAIFAGAFFFGETVILTAALLAQQGWWSVHLVFWISLVATVISDCLWFLAGHYVFNKKKWFLKYEHKYAKLVLFLDKKVGHRPYLALLIIKFLYGTRVLTIIYLAVRRVSFWKFLLFDTLGTFLLLLVVVPLGWLAGKGIGSIHLFDNLTYILTAIVVLILVYKIIVVWVSKRVIKE